MSKRVVGLDLSLTSTGWAVIHDDGTVDSGKITSKAPADLKTRTVAWFNSSLGRISYLMLKAAEIAEGSDLVVIEGISVGAKGSSVDRMFGMWWLVLAELRTHGYAVAVVTPGQLKQYLTGKGNAQKDAVLAEVIKRLPGDVHGNDEADALGLAAMGADHLGHPIAVMPQTHRVALAKVDWPALAPREVGHHRQMALDVAVP